MDSQAWGGKRGLENRSNLYKHRTPDPTRMGPLAQFETWHPPEVSRGRPDMSWTCSIALLLWSIQMSFELHAAVLAIEATDRTDSNWHELHVADLCSAVSETSMISWLPVHLSIRTVCSAWHTHTGKKCHYCHCHVFRNSTRKWKRPYRSHNCTFGKICEVLDFLISFKFHECLETMLASTPASLGHQRSKCDFHLDPISLANAIQAEIFVFSISPPCTDFTHFTELSQGEIALRDGLACAVIQVHHFASGAQQGSLRSRSQLKQQLIRRLVHCEFATERYYTRIESDLTVAKEGVKIVKWMRIRNLFVAIAIVITITSIRSKMLQGICWSADYRSFMKTVQNWHR